MRMEKLYIPLCQIKLFDLWLMIPTMHANDITNEKKAAGDDIPRHRFWLSAFAADCKAPKALHM